MQHDAREHVVTVGEHVRFDRDPIADDALGGERPPSTAGRDVLDDDARVPAVSGARLRRGMPSSLARARASSGNAEHAPAAASVNVSDCGAAVRRRGAASHAAEVAHAAAAVHGGVAVQHLAPAPARGTPSR